MKTSDISITHLELAPWNPNRMDEITSNRLRESILRYGLVEPLIVRTTGEECYEVLSGNQRLKIIREMGVLKVPCVITELDDTRAMLLAQALNNLHGEDDLALKGTLLKQILSSIAEDEVLSILPESVENLRSLSNINEVDLAEHLQAWEKAQAARLRHMQLQLTEEQLKTVETAISDIASKIKETRYDNPNTRGNAIFTLCQFYLERKESS